MTMVRKPVTADTARRMPVVARLAKVARLWAGVIRVIGGLAVAIERGHPVYRLLGADYRACHHGAGWIRGIFVP